MRALWRWMQRLANARGGISLGGPATNSIRDIVNTVNSGGGPPSLPLNSVQFHSPLNSFKGSENLRYIEGTGLLVGDDVKVVLDSNTGAGTNYWKHNSSNGYNELYADGQLRIQA